MGVNLGLSYGGKNVQEGVGEQDAEENISPSFILLSAAL
jgi:hypothetical protein